jgi:DNA-binding MarR family transcriptional regulator
MTPDAVTQPNFSDADYRKLAAFRAALRKFLRRSEEIVQAAGLTPQQHQTLLAIKGFENKRRPAIKDVAALLQIRHNSAVGLISRLDAHGYLRRVASQDDRRSVFVELTHKGEAMLQRMTHAHRAELRHIGPEIRRLLTELAG